MINKSTLQFLDLYLLIDISEKNENILNHFNGKMSDLFIFLQSHQSQGYCDATIRFFNTRPEDHNNLEEHFGKFIWEPVYLKKTYTSLENQLQLVYRKFSELNKTHYPAEIYDSFVIVLTDRINENLKFNVKTFEMNKYLFYLGDLSVENIAKLNSFTSASNKIVFSNDRILLLDIIFSYLETIVVNMSNLKESLVEGPKFITKLRLLEKLISYTGFKRGSTNKSEFLSNEIIEFELAFNSFLSDIYTKTEPVIATANSEDDWKTEPVIAAANSEDDWKTEPVIAAANSEDDWKTQPVIAAANSEDDWMNDLANYVDDLMNEPVIALEDDLNLDLDLATLLNLFFKKNPIFKSQIINSIDKTTIDQFKNSIHAIKNRGRVKLE